jgi:hypothetical protein
MSVSLFGIGLDIEDTFGVAITREDWGKLSARCDPPDIRVGDLFDLIQAKGPGKRVCAKCRYDLRGHVSPGVCPECGGPFDDWDKLYAVFRDSYGIPPSGLSRDSLLIRDFERHW